MFHMSGMTDTATVVTFNTQPGNCQTLTSENQKESHMQQEAGEIQEEKHPFLAFGLNSDFNLLLPDIQRQVYTVGQ